MLSAAELTESPEAVISEQSDDRPGHEESSVASDAVGKVSTSSGGPPGKIAITEGGGGDGDADPPAAPVGIIGSLL